MRDTNDESLSEYERKITTGTMGAFGRYLIERTFDEAVHSLELVLNGQPASDSGQALRDRLQRLTGDERRAVEQLVRSAVVAALHGFLHGLSHDDERIRLFFDGLDVASASDGLHGDLFLWLRAFSRYPHEPRGEAPILDLDDPEYDFSFLDDE